MPKSQLVLHGAGPSLNLLQLALRIPEVLVKVVCLLLQLLVLPLGLPEIRLELIDLKLEIGCPLLNRRNYFQFATRLRLPDFIAIQ
ncbi:hypothetical protein B296_00009322 [Ensete ventricosum]|uniref:Uncharacterized protein n=1 Tax=Ensete ventricosum TaxID=4639 RepID=A0A427AJD4_ENSVE|nr:hypothetical protein B296_00009322 [Ensete ventricosum]